MLILSVWTINASTAVFLVSFKNASAVYLLLELSVHCIFHHPFSGVNIFSFQCYILNQIDHGVPMLKAIMHFWGLEKLMNVLAFRSCVS